MPHQIIEYSSNVRDHLDMDGLVAALHAQAAQLSALPLAGLRTRAYAADSYRIADNHADNAFIAVYLRIGAGRDEALRIEMGEILFQCLCSYAQQWRGVDGSPPVALSYEVQEIDPATRWNRNHLRDYVEQRQQQEQQEQTGGAS